MKKPILLVSAIAMCVVLTGFAITAFAGTYTLVKNYVEAGGDVDALRSGLRHHTDRISIDKDGSIRGRLSAHPILEFLGMLVLAWAGTVGSALAVDALGRRYARAKKELP